MTQTIHPSYADKETLDHGGDTWLSGEEVLQQTGISKNDLVRFIQLGVLPKSMMRVSPVGRDGSRKKSYFSRSALGHVAMLKLLRDEGHSVETIAMELREAGDASQLPRNPSLTELYPEAPAADKEPEESTSPHYHLSADTIPASTFFVNHDLRIDWIKVDLSDRLSQAISDERANDPSGTVFDIMLRASLRELVFNWQPLFSFTYRFLRQVTAEETFNRLAPTISMSQAEPDQANESDAGGDPAGPIDSCAINLDDDDGRTQNMRIYGIALAEGTLFFLSKERGQNAHAGSTATQPDGTPRADAQAASGKTPFSVISARLDDSRSIVDTLLPETYFQLMTRIWDESDRVLASYGGHRAKRSGTEVQYIIPRHAGTDPAYDAICCAVELKEKMREIEKSLKSEGGWFADLRLNIGISSGRDHLQQEDLTASMAFMLPGGAADQAFHLSAIAHGGAIWITKSAFSHLTAQQMKRITFGIYREDRLIPNIFAQVSDLPHAPDTPPLGRGIRSLSVTRIIAMQSDRI
ncbi:hypothetical protein [Desulfosarcina sp.]|uniref:hypothetical protein n=1 Tax=Desulfosarcina sp. TaxID=2027861 RepID=UPI003970D7E9